MIRILALLAAVIVIGCGESQPASKTPVDMSNDVSSMPDMSTDLEEDQIVGLVLTPADLELHLNETQRISADYGFLIGDSQPAEDVVWSSNDDSIAEVTSDGVVIAKNIGTAQVSAVSGEFEASLEVHVLGPPVATMNVRPDGEVIAIGGTVTLVVELFDAQNAPILDARTVVYTSSDENVLTVDDQGVVTAEAPGAASITVTVEGIEATVSFTVPDVSVESISIEPTMVRLDWGDTATLTANIVYDGPTPDPEPVVSWVSSDPSIVSVDASGTVSAISTVTALSAGTVTITASAGGVMGTRDVISEDAFSSISAGRAHVCGLMNKKVVCWGENASGQLGHTQNGPGRLAFDQAVDELALGDAHSCLIAESNGSVWCWGDDTRGQLGNDASGSSALPRQIALADNTNFVTIAAGAEHTCAGKANGDLYCWGNGADGRLGNDATLDVQTPTRIGTYFRPALGTQHSCFTSSADEGFCTGANTDGRLGHNTFTTNEQTPVLVLGGFEFASLHLGARHSCGVTVLNTLACWGANDLHQIGDGTTTNRSTPILVPTPTPLTRVDVGDDHSCGLSAQGAAYCWGAYSQGAVGQAANQDVTVPTQISGSTTFFDIATGAEFSCGLATGGDPYCWGDGDAGQLGGAADSSTPVRINPF